MLDIEETDLRERNVTFSSLLQGYESGCSRALIGLSEVIIARIGQVDFVPDLKSASPLSTARRCLVVVPSLVVAKF